MASDWPKVIKVKGEGEERFVIGLPPTRDPSVSWKGYEASVPMLGPFNETDLRRELKSMGQPDDQVEAKIREARKAD